MQLALSAQMRQLLRRVPAVRSTYRKLYGFYYSPPVQQKVSRLREWMEERNRSNDFSIEFTITGRNDDYEPNWRGRLESVLCYNRALFALSDVDFRVAFVEWNPPKGRPLLSPSLVRQFDFLRAIVVHPKVHEDLCQSRSLLMMLNFGLNAAVRTSESDFVVISGGDVFLGRDVAQYFTTRGLRRGYLYRAIRVDIRPDLDFQRPDADVLEDTRNVVRVNQDSQPPYYNACGDFILMDRASFQRVRGFDERIRNARLHLDSRCCASAMALGLRCKLLGHVYHVDHSRSHVNTMAEGSGNTFDVQTDIPYHNPETWGLQDRKWVKLEDRLDSVS